jgi:putative phosphoribosyl transferase
MFSTGAPAQPVHTGMKRFENRTHAGRLLAKRLSRYSHQQRGLVLALPRGGVPVAFAIAQRLELPLDVIPVRKLGVPGHEELAMGAIAEGGLCVTKVEVISMFGIDSTLVDAVAYRELREIDRQAGLYRAGRPPLHLQRRTVILVDDGLATGATMMAAVKTIRKQHPDRLIIAVPVGSAETCKEMQQFADEVVCLLTPQPFYAVGQGYEDFGQTPDEEVLDLLAKAREWSEAHPQEPASEVTGAPVPEIERDSSHSRTH